MQRAYTILAIAATIALALAPAARADHHNTMQKGDVALMSAGPLAFGPEGVLFIADHKAAAIHAVATADPAATAKPIDVKGIDSKVAALLGVAVGDVLINDMAVSPVSGAAYLSVSRGRGPDASAVILRVAADGAITELSLKGVASSSAKLPNPTAPPEPGRRSRGESITDIAFSDGQVFVAGLSNEEFASNLRAIPFPFTGVGKGASVEIYHGAHGAWETRSPIRTFIPYEIEEESHLLAAYTCTPLVKFPIDDLEDGKKVVGITIAELGNRNRPLDMIAYKKGGQDFILMNNSSRGVMKIPTSGMAKQEGIKDRISGTAGVGYETIETLEGVEQLDRLDDGHALIIAKGDSGQDLRTIALP